MRIAAIDIGTNSIHMVIADPDARGAFSLVERERDVVQIGRGSFASGRLRGDAVRRAVESLARMAELARRLRCDRILCTATAAVREARNGGEFLQRARAASGVAPRVIPAEEEGRLIWLAVRNALELGHASSVIVDIGGGSMQLVVGDRDVLKLAVSAPLGALRLTETLLAHDPPDQGELAELKRRIRKQAKGVIEQVQAFGPTTVYGSSGAIHALAEAIHWEQHGHAIEQINGHVLETVALEKLVKRLETMSLAERRELHGMDARRAEIILPGALVLLQVLQALDAKGVTLSDYGVREGLVADWIERHTAELTRMAGVDDLRARSVHALLDRFGADGPHPRHVARLALALFDGLRDAHGLGDDRREMLHYAAMLHDIGSVVGFEGHAEHSAYVIRNGMLRGLAADEVDLIAMVARYHSKSVPRKRNPAFAALPKKRRREVRWLSGILRVAEALDRTHYQLIQRVGVQRLGDAVVIRVSARGDAGLERWAAERRLDLLARMIGNRKHPARVRLELEALAPESAEAATVDETPRSGVMWTDGAGTAPDEAAAGNGGTIEAPRLPAGDQKARGAPTPLPVETSS